MTVIMFYFSFCTYCFLNISLWLTMFELNTSKVIIFALVLYQFPQKSILLAYISAWMFYTSCVAHVRLCMWYFSYQAFGCDLWNMCKVRIIRMFFIMIFTRSFEIITSCLMVVVEVVTPLLVVYQAENSVLFCLLRFAQ